MSKKMKKLAAASLAIVCAASMSGCSDSGYIGTVNGIQIPNGMYLFYVAVNGYNEAASQIKEEQGDESGTAEVTVFNNTIEGKSASAWLKDYAVTKLRRYAAIEELFAQYGLSLTDEEKTERITSSPLTTTWECTRSTTDCRTVSPLSVSTTRAWVSASPPCA